MPKVSLIYPNSEGLKGKFFPVVLLDDEPKELAMFRHGGEIISYYCLHVAFIKTNKIGEQTHGVSGLIGPQAVMRKTTEGQSEQLDFLINGKNTIKGLKAGQIYWVGLRDDQKQLWEGGNWAEIDSYQSTLSAEEALAGATEYPDANSIILTSGFFIESDGKQP
ncbi:MAG: hypothetical protein AB9907_07780 [Flexilinea sp.]